ncbi:hypothetical protein C0J52_27677 [Blattella germanica]|nr:hypothetical protein C0J52_27677 [Blattella germanica]
MQFCVSAILFVTGAVLVRSASLPEEAQSPIDIDNFKERTCPKLVYKKCNNNALAKLENTGHTVRITIKGTQPLLTGGPLKSDYTFHEVHFHWGKSNREGSEHTKRGSQYPMEAHVVHYKTKYDSFSKASEKKDGLAIIGIFFDISTSNNSQRSDKDADNEQLKPLVALLRDVAKAQERVENSAS